MQKKLLNYCNLSVFSDSVIEFIFEKNSVNGFITQSGRKIKNIQANTDYWNFFEWFDTCW